MLMVMAREERDRGREMNIFNFEVSIPVTAQTTEREFS